MTSLSRNEKQNLRHSLARSNFSIFFCAKGFNSGTGPHKQFYYGLHGDIMAPESLPYSLTRNYRTCRLQVGKLTQGRKSEGLPAGAFSGPSPGPRDARAGDVIMMAGAGGAAGPAPVVHHQPPGKSIYSTRNCAAFQVVFTLVEQWLWQLAGMHKVMSSSPTPCLFFISRYTGSQNRDLVHAMYIPGIQTVQTCMNTNIHVISFLRVYIRYLFMVWT